MGRKLLTVRTDTGIQIVELKPGPYSYSAPVETVVFDMTAEEAADMEDEDRRGKQSVTPATGAANGSTPTT